jgi:hypothetical protein
MVSMTYRSHASTGWNSLDTIIDHLRIGDNVVWQVDEITDYQRLVTPFVESAAARGERVVYMRFARHAPLVEAGENITVHHLPIESGFESFSADVHSIITREGQDACYVFDSLSELLHVWATDLMIGDFFFITCPYLFELNTIAYFAIQRHRHSFKAIARIREITQVLIDVYQYEGRLCIHPVKVKHRYSPTMFFPHIMDEENLEPVINSMDATRIFSDLTRAEADSARRHLDYWDRLFIEAKELLESGGQSEEKADMVEQLSRLMLSRNKQMLSLIRRFMGLEDLIRIKERMIGTGFIGGKSVGMLLSRQILACDDGLEGQEGLEPHDSFFIGSDVFYSYIVQNGWWKLFMAHKTSEGYFAKAAELKNKMLGGIFAEEISEKFQLMLEYFGQSPIIVRSSSLLEDAYGNAFAGKYDSFFCVNQGPPEKRYEDFITAVRYVYASTMSRDALAYRRQRGLEESDEQMALLVQRVSGAYRKHYFFPELAGVGLSRNPFIWQKAMDARAGMVRLVAGLGTRAVNRVQNDYPRIIALDYPLAKPLAGIMDIRKYSQHRLDLLNLEQNQLEAMDLRGLVENRLIARIDLLGVRDTEAAEQMRQMGRSAGEYWILTFDPFLEKTPFTRLMRDMLGRLEAAYGTPVDIEFTVNFGKAGELRVNLLQCRPFQPIGDFDNTVMPGEIAHEQTILRIEGNFMGGNLVQPISTIIWIVPDAYAKLSPPEKFAVARLAGKLNQSLKKNGKRATLLMGPGRWGTQSPEMGIPVKFSEINNIAAIAEISHQMGNMIPDLSFGTHFFHDLIETGIFYMAIYPESAGVVFKADWLQSLPNQLESVVPAAGHLRDVVKIADTSEYGLMLASDISSQQVICYLTNPSGGSY